MRISNPEGDLNIHNLQHVTCKPKKDKEKKKKDLIPFCATDLKT